MDGNVLELEVGRIHVIVHHPWPVVVVVVVVS